MGPPRSARFTSARVAQPKSRREKTTGTYNSMPVKRCENRAWQRLYLTAHPQSHEVTLTIPSPAVASKRVYRTHL